jgi:NAD(P)-dependent dehydrogenase (short-subunit alcohol dehydrogenase family)
MTVLVTGAAGGIGAAVVRKLADDGHRVLAHDLLPVESGESGIRRLSGDLRSADCLAELRELADGEQLSGVVAAHGIDGSGSLAQLEPALVRRIMQINFTTVTGLYGATEPALARGGGSFVAVASANGLIGEAENSAYCASKFAIVGWARTLAPKAAERGISIQVMCPGCTDTPLLRQGLAGFAEASGRPEREVTDEYLESIPAGRFARPAEIAGAVACLLALRPATGAVWAVTGGQVLA